MSQESIGVENEKDKINVSSLPALSEQEKAQYDFIIKRVKDAKEQRDQQLEEFDDMMYENDYLLNRRTLNTYLKKKKNEDDVRINTGIAEKKVEMIVNEIMMMNLTPEVRAYDEQDLELSELGTDFADIVKRTNQIENDEDKTIDILLELFSQRAVFVEEFINEFEVKGRDGKKQILKRCEKRLLSGLQVYLGDIKIPAYDLHKQPYIVKYIRRSYDETAPIYKSWDRWQYVKPGSIDMSQQQTNPFAYRMYNIGKNEIEELHYMDFYNNEYQVIINGIPMCELGENLPWNYEGYNITMVVWKSIPGLAYGKSPITCAKTLQALDNETIRNLIRKFRQALEPPIGVKSGKVYSRDIWSPGAITQGIKTDDYTKLIDHQGVTQSEMAMETFIEQKTNEFLGTNSLTNKITGKPTATQLNQAKAEAIKMLGMSVLAAMRLKRNLTFLRIFDIIELSKDPIKKEKNKYTNEIENIYNFFTVSDADLGDGHTGKKVVQFVDKSPTSEMLQDVFSYEQKMQQQSKEPFRYKFINTKLLQQVRVNWYVSVVQREKDSSDLSKAMFTEKLSQGAAITQLTGRRFSADKVVDEFERTWNTKDLFEKQTATSQSGMAGQGGAPEQAGDGGANVADDIMKTLGKPERPSLNKMHQ